MCVNSASTVLRGAGINGEIKSNKEEHVIAACSEASRKGLPWMTCLYRRNRSTRPLNISIKPLIEAASARMKFQLFALKLRLFPVIFRAERYPVKLT